MIFVAQWHSFPGFTDKVSSHTHFSLKLGWDNDSLLDQAIAEFEQGLDFIVTDSIETLDLDASFQKPDVFILWSTFGTGVTLFFVTCWMFISLQPTSIVPFLILNSVPTSATLSGAADSSLFLIPTSWCDSYYGCHTHSLGFIFQGSGLPFSIIGSWSGSVYKVHIAFQGVQPVVLMLHRMAFQLSGKVVALHSDNSTVMAYLCN